MSVATPTQTGTEETLQMIAKMIQDFGERAITPNRNKWDDDQHFPVEVMKELGNLGLMGVLVPEEYGGSGFGYQEYVTAISELAVIDPSIGLSMAVENKSLGLLFAIFSCFETRLNWI